MNAIAFSDARRRLAEVADHAEEAPVFITRAGRETLVLMNAVELSSLNETAYLLSTQENRDSLTRALDDFKAGRFVEVSIDDLLRPEPC